MTNKALLVSLLVPAACFLIAVAIAPFGCRRLQVHYLRKVDHTALVQAGRSLINKYAPEFDKRSVKQVGIPVDEAPYEIRSLKPLVIIVRNDYVLIGKSAMPRLFVLIFREGAVEFGNERLAPGLWYAISPARFEREASMKKNDTQSESK